MAYRLSEYFAPTFRTREMHELHIIAKIKYIILGSSFVLLIKFSSPYWHNHHNYRPYTNRTIYNKASISHDF